MTRWEVTYISPLEQYPPETILPIRSHRSLGWAEYHDAVVPLGPSTMSLGQQDQAVDATLMASQISWSMLKLRAKLIEIQIVIHLNIFHCTIQCMHRTATRSIHYYYTDSCIGVISTIIGIAVALTCTQTRDDGKVYRALRSVPETNSLR